MKVPNWDRIQEIYHAALEVPRSERSSFVAKAAADDSRLLHKVNALLAADNSPNEFLQTPVFELGSISLAEPGLTDPPADSLEGMKIDGRYLVDRKLNSGGHGVVYLARALDLHGKLVVVKVLLTSLLHDSYARQKFKQEAEALSRIDHPGVIGIIDAGELIDGRPYIVMRFIEGETLNAQIPAEGMNLERAASILKQIGEALDHVHEKGIFHRDLKPLNIMVKDDSDAVVLIDFSIAKVKDSVVGPSTVSGVSVGTVLYMSPEQLSGQKVTAACDIYSMGLIAYEMLTGRRPFNPASAAQLLEMQRAGVKVKPISLRPSLPRRAQTMILRTLSFSPQSRYKSAGGFGNDLAGVLGNEKEVHQNRWWIPIARKQIAFICALVILLGLAVIGILLLRRPPPPPPTRSFTYYLTVQKTRDGKDYQEPFKSNGEDIFDSGDKFRLTVSSPEPGYVYVISESAPASRDTSFTMVYPTPIQNSGSATVGANQPIQSDWITFQGPEGDENLWILWSISPVSQLESVKTEAFTQTRGGLIGNSLLEVKEFLRIKQSEVEVRVTHYKSSQTAVVRGKNDLLVTLAQFKHR